MKTVLLIAIFAVALTGLAAPVEAALHRVDLTGSAFVPAELQVAVGDSVTWGNLDAFQHTVTSGASCTGDGIFDSGLLDQDDEFGWRFADVGTIPYFCSLHCQGGMTGTIVVIQDTSAETQTWGKIRALYR